MTNKLKTRSQQTMQLSFKILNGFSPHGRHTDAMIGFYLNQRLCLATKAWYVVAAV